MGGWGGGGASRRKCGQNGQENDRTTVGQDAKKWRGNGRGKEGNGNKKKRRKTEIMKGKLETIGEWEE